jgi:hypothetical protein
MEQMMYVECKNGAVLYILDAKAGRCEVVVEPLNGETYKHKHITLKVVERQMDDINGVSLYGGVHGKGFDVVRPVPDDILKVVNALYYVALTVGTIACIGVGALIAKVVLG